MVYSVFSVGAVFMEKFTKQNGNFSIFWKKNKKITPFSSEFSPLESAHDLVLVAHLIHPYERIIFHPLTFSRDSRCNFPIVSIFLLWIEYYILIMHILYLICAHISYLCTWHNILNFKLEVLKYAFLGGRLVILAKYIHYEIYMKVILLKICFLW